MCFGRLSITLVSVASDEFCRGDFIIEVFVCFISGNCDLLGSLKMGNAVDIKQELLSILDEILSLGGRGRMFTLDTPLLGAIPELDSMAVVALIGAMEERFGFMVDDDEIDGSTFESVGTMVDFVQAKLEV